MSLVVTNPPIIFYCFGFTAHYLIVVKATARNFHVVLILEATVDKNDQVSSTITTSYDFKNKII